MADELNIDQSDDEDRDQVNQKIYVLNSRVCVCVCEVCAYVSIITPGTTSSFSFHKCIILFPGRRE